MYKNIIQTDQQQVRYDGVLECDVCDRVNGRNRTGSDAGHRVENIVPEVFQENEVGHINTCAQQSITKSNREIIWYCFFSTQRRTLYA